MLLLISQKSVLAWHEYPFTPPPLHPTAIEGAWTSPFRGKGAELLQLGLFRPKAKGNFCLRSKPDGGTPRRHLQHGNMSSQATQRRI